MKTQQYRGKAKEAFERGLDAGLEHARYCDLSLDNYTEAYHDDTLGEILGDIVEGYRQYSPFEFTAAEFNRARNSEALWEAYDNGEYKGWIEGLEKRFGKPTTTHTTKRKRYARHAIVSMCGRVAITETRI